MLCYSKIHEVRLCSWAFSVGQHKWNIYVAASEAWGSSAWNNTQACMSKYMWPEFFTLKQMGSLFQELSEATAFALPCGNTGSEELRESRLNLDTSSRLWPQKLITFKLPPALDSLTARKLGLGNVILLCLCAEAGMCGLCLYTSINFLYKTDHF